MKTEDFIRFMEIIGRLANHTDQLAKNQKNILDRIEMLEKKLNDHIVKSEGFLG